MLDTKEWADRVDAVVNDSIQKQNVGQLRAGILALVAEAYGEGIGASAATTEKRQLVAYLVPSCTPPGESPGMDAIENARQLVDEIYATVK